MAGWNSQHNGWVTPTFCNMHDHFRDPVTQSDLFKYVVPVTARQFRYATAMPNLGPNRIRTVTGALAYRQAIRLIGRTVNPDFDCNVPLYLEPNTDPNLVREGFATGAWIAVKLYPRGGTHGAEEGVDFNRLHELDAVFAVMAELGMILLVHAEPQHDHDGKQIDVDAREERSLEMIAALLKRHPKLKVVMEHITTEAAARWVVLMQMQGYAVEATVAPQYLIWNHNVLYDGGMNPAWYSIPKLKHESDRLYLCNFILDHGFLGTDSAPHGIASKSKPLGCPGGVFNEPTALPVYFQVFRQSDHREWFERFVDFACFRGPRFYGLPVNERDAMLITEVPWQMPEICKSDSGETQIIPMLAGKPVPYTISTLH